MTVDMTTAWDPGTGQVTTDTPCDPNDSDSDNLDAHIDQLTLDIIAEGAEGTIDKLTTSWPGLGNPPGPVRTDRAAGETFRQYIASHKANCQAALSGNPIDYS